MKLLHTSDWHLGHTLLGRRRYAEFTAFLEWLVNIIEQEKIDVLLLAGDVFDTSTPGNRVTALYYEFLYKIAKGFCRHVIITSGNHDSSMFLDAPKELLHALHIHVIGAIKNPPEDEVLLLQKKNNDPELIVCAVPYLRDKDIRQVTMGESVEDKDRHLFEGIKNHYRIVGEVACKLKQENSIPLIVMGHLFAAGGHVIEGDGIRELYVGSLVHVPASIFPPEADYVALGHLHSAQRVNGNENIRYSGSPLPMSFVEAKQEKNVVVIEFSEACSSQISMISVPVFQKIEQITGTLENIQRRLEELVAKGENVWIEVIYNGLDVIPHLRQTLESLVEGTSLELLRIKDARGKTLALSSIEMGESLETLTPTEVFTRCLNDQGVPDEQRAELHQAFAQVIAELSDRDSRTE